MLRRELKKINSIIVHGSASAWGNYESFRKWHVTERGWDDIGYHYVIYNGNLHSNSKYSYYWDGWIQPCRPITFAGAHCKGYNTNSIGICLVSEPKENVGTERQRKSLLALITYLSNQFMIEHLWGHNELNKNKIDPYLYTAVSKDLIIGRWGNENICFERTRQYL